MKNIMNWFMKEESGQGMVEYGLILALISVVVIALLTSIGGQLKVKFGEVLKALQGNGQRS
ncbi:Flp family type IVb pilin [Helcococcus ovis]|uniref:Flp family type IVb pilin n=1 Tax=Helcococcus ovis TaxID=72026 RepID=UPI001070120B|nr:Flp family type IVb pilin [Helcococcus ovis]TFF65515.1 Flp family type IVb pilin [Helcococcus ovis]WNZ00776.1 Flp family type IVb pilin [Helcococcus ovis]